MYCRYACYCEAVKCAYTHVQFVFIVRVLRLVSSHPFSCTVCVAVIMRVLHVHQFHLIMYNMFVCHCQGTKLASVTLTCLCMICADMRQVSVYIRSVYDCLISNGVDVLCCIDHTACVLLYCCGVYLVCMWCALGVGCGLEWLHYTAYG